MARATLPPLAPGRAPPSPDKVSPTPWAPDFKIIIDTQEQAPYLFRGLTCDSRHNYRPIVVPCVRRKLRTGDYSIEGFEDLISVERKSVSDLFGSLAGKDGERRGRLDDEHDRMAQMKFFGGWVALVIEGDMHESITNPPDHGANPLAVLTSSATWPQRFGVPWVWAGTRAMAERWTWKFLECAYEDLKTSRGRRNG